MKKKPLNRPRVDGSYFVGIDPGKSGGIAFLDAKGTVLGTYKLDPKTNTEHDVAQFLSSCKLVGTYAVLERVRSSPQQGVVSAFTFGSSYGFLRGLLTGLGIPYEEVLPARWQKTMGCMSKGDKNVTKAAAQRLFPSQKIIHATADAILLAEYCRRTRLLK